MKIRPVGAELLHADRRTDRRDEAIVAVCNFSKAPNNSVKSKNCSLMKFYFFAEVCCTVTEVIDIYVYVCNGKIL